MGLFAIWLLWRKRQRNHDVARAFNILAEYCDRQAASYRQKDREERAISYENTANEIRNHIPWVCAQMDLHRKIATNYLSE